MTRNPSAEKKKLSQLFGITGTSASCKDFAFKVNLTYRN